MDQIQLLRRSGHTSLRFERAEKDGEEEKSAFQSSTKLPTTALLANAA